MLSTFALLATLSAFSATPTRNPPPLVTAAWKGAPENFQATEFLTQWSWVDAGPHELGPSAVVHSETTVRLPTGWEFKSAKPGGVTIVSVKKDPAAPGHWTFVAEQDVAAGSAELAFLDEHDKPHALTLELHSESRHPYLLTKATCSDYDITLEPGIATGHFLYLIVNCSEFGDDVIVYFARSPDGRWVPGKEIRNAKAISFEYRFPKAGGSRDLFTLHTEDGAGRRAEWLVKATEN